MDRFSNRQKIALAIMPMPTGLLSALASGSVIYSILRSRVRLKVPYRRLVFGISLFDFLSSISYAMSTIPVPKEKSLVPSLSFGNEVSCSFQAFFFITGYMGGVLFSCSLCLYYYYSIKKQISFRVFAKKIEPYLHGIAIGWAFLISIVCLSDRAFDATPTHCSIASDPPDCIQYDDVECIKGERAYIYQWAFLGVPCWIVFFTIIFIMLSIGK